MKKQVTFHFSFAGTDVLSRKRQMMTASILYISPSTKFLPHYLSFIHLTIFLVNEVSRAIGLLQQQHTLDEAHLDEVGKVI